MSRLLLGLLLLGGCSAFNDQCDKLCADTRDALEACICVQGQGANCVTGALTWEDVGAAGPGDFRQECSQDWESERADLSSSDLSLHIDACEETRDQMNTGKISCDELIALYGPQP